MNSINLFVPQWQGSGVSSELFQGAEVLRDYFEQKSREFRSIEISNSLSLQIENNIFAYSTIRTQLERISDTLHTMKPGTVFTVGGGCGIEIPVVSYLSSCYEDLDVLWFDAHGDLNTPDSSPSKYFHGMPLRFLLDNIPDNDISSRYGKIACENVVLVGGRDLDDPEVDFIEQNKLKLISPLTSGADPAYQLKALLNPSNKNAYIHIDLDVLDPGEYRNVKCPARGGYSVHDVAEMIRTVRAQRNIVGLSLLENTEVNPSKLNVLDELLELAEDLF